MKRQASQDRSDKRALHESRERYRRLIDNALIGIYQVEKGGHFIMANRKMAGMFGYASTQDFLSSVENIAELYERPEERPVILKEIEEKGFVKDKEVRLIRKGGKRFWGKLDATFHREGNRIIYEGVLEDISERKQAEDALKESENKYRDLVENIAEVVYRTDDKGRVIYVSQNIEAIGGYTQDYVLEKGFMEFIHPDDLEDRLKNFHNIMSGRSVKSEYRVITKDKQIVWVRTNAMPILKDGRPVGVQGILNDITERKAMEDVMRQNAERLETLIHALPMGIAIIDPETHKIIDVNPKAVLMIGAPADRIIGSRCHNLICPAEAGQCPFTDCGQTVVNAEDGLLTADGEILAVHKTVLPLQIDEKDLLLECFIDLSEQKRAEQERLKKEKLKGVVEMAGAVCHELNQPLQTISGFSELLMMEMEKDMPQYEKIGIIKDQIDRMGQITKKLMRTTSYETKVYLDNRIIDIEKSSKDNEPVDARSDL
jgi:PAS domain S-box-containing protein